MPRISTMDTSYACDTDQFDYKQDQYLEIPIPKEMISRRLHKDWRVFVLVANSVTIPENFMTDREDPEPQMREALLSQTLANDKVKTINLNNIRGL